MNHIESKELILTKLETSPESGLTAEQAAVAQAAKGLNEFDEEKKETALTKFFKHMKDFTVLILLAAGGIAAYSAFQPNSEKGFTDAIVIFSIVIINVTLAIKQELGAEKALEALKNMNAPMTSVLRGGKRETIDAKQLVPGDILVLGAGDLIPADARLIESINLKVDEAVLTGESVPVEKDSDFIISDKSAPLGDRLNMLFSGCVITNGRAKAVVVETGMTTEMGKIARLLTSAVKERTPLQQKMDKLAKTICVAAIVAGGLLFGLQSLLTGVDGQIATVSERLLYAVVLAVAAIPECLPIVVTITLAFGVTTMARRNAIIRKIPAVETLGSASVICSDKTGTLTQNKMAIQQVWTLGYEPKSAAEKFNHDEIRLITLMGLANNAKVTFDEETKTFKEVGDPTELAIARLLHDKHIELESIEVLHPRVHEIPFDSTRKLMTTVHECCDLYAGDDVKYIAITKGAFDRIPADATSFCQETAKNIHDEFANKALRVLAVAYKYYDKLPERLDEAELEHGLTFAGLVGMIDPPREESKVAVATAKEAGIRTVMITGDHVATASAIAREIGILQDGDKVMTGAELNDISDDVLAATVKDYSVYARVSPEDKIRIVRAWQSHNAVVAMTGDGVNDAPALKAADVGVAMGSGTDVSKGASDMILTDDNFASIISAIEEGRRVYDNVRKVLISLIPSNISEIFVMLLGFILFRASPFAAIQLLFINVIADGIPDLCMCREKLERDAMRRKPIGKNESIFAFGLASRTITVAVIFTVLTMIAYFIGRFAAISPDFEPSHEIGRTMAYLTLAYCSVVNIFNVRSFKESVFKIGFASNRLLFGGICLSFSLIAMTALVPGVRDVFYCVPLSPGHWLTIAGFALVPFVVIEIKKAVIRAGDSKHPAVFVQ
jgi:calcium-translocating P-type ATPase